MENSADILKELYAIDPSLKEYEGRLLPILQKLIREKPASILDPAFVQTLKQRLVEDNKLPETAAQSSIINFFSMNKFAYGSFAVLTAMVIAGVSFYAGQKKSGQLIKLPNISDTVSLKNNPKTQSSLKTFASGEEYLSYLETAQSSYGYGGGGGLMEKTLVAPMSASDSAGILQNEFRAAPTSNLTANSAPRSSQTNTQVLSIDEPDVVKNDGKNLFVSIDNPIYYFRQPLPFEGDMPQPGSKILPPYSQPQSQTQILAAFPPEGLKKLGKIDKQGELLLSGNTLMIFSYEGVSAFDVSDKQNPKTAWKLKYEQNSQLATARLFEGKLYMVTRSYPDYGLPCPIMPLSVDNAKIEIACNQIYHPVSPISDTSLFSAFKIDPKNGQVENKSSFMGSYGQSVAYMSENALYITYSYQPDQIKTLLSFLNEDGKNFFSSELISKIKRLDSYELSQSAKMVELQNLLYSWQKGADQDEMLKKQTELENLAQSYIKKHQRELSLTGIAKISLKNMSVEKTASVPGTPLNQFSLDEYKNNLRIAVTIGSQGGFFWGGWSASQNTVNDVYVLDSDLDISGAVRDLGKGETIHSARFIGNRGYVVTFRQTDPFYVLDLSNAKNPQLSGELKIPGFSSYLHPLKDDLILGVGQENSKVKLSLFDVSNPTNPLEVDKYMLNEYWSEAQQNHHAFLQDEKYQVFFLPGGQNGYVVSYKNNRLNLEKAIASTQTKRAVYMGDYLYIIGTDKISVYSEKTWEKVKELDIQ